jgi:NAD(P)-dependent dehydrogenase (short-subunit alcohol dehydrogenase family)
MNRPPATPAQLFSLEGRTAIVTGASSGLGARFAQVLACAGAQVAAAARRQDRLAALCERDTRIHAVPCDVTRPEGRRELVDRAVALTGQVDVLVNNAGASGRLNALEEEADEFERVLEVNLVAAFDLARLVCGSRSNRDGLTIVNIASILGLVSGAPVAGAGYTASKAGLIGLTRELAGQWGKDGVRVNALAPGWFRSEMTAELFDDDSSEGWLSRNTMLRRVGREDELDGALLYLASPASSYMTGQVLVVDGGWTAR